MQGATGISSINSVRNELLMLSTLHTAFEQYIFSINPDGSKSMAGLTLETLTLKTMATRLPRSNLTTGG